MSRRFFHDRLVELVVFMVIVAALAAQQVWG
ncbi:Uncharacterized protein ChrSV_2342 [Chromobacterium vaccinii]|nr:Uncharacterized protein ChrSW_2342 [Chromobacterium vaccinii]QND89799.1 Uncharacterized protein ChrSV_2342 [Chromobacterium vaccinii]